MTGTVHTFTIIHAGFSDDGGQRSAQSSNAAETRAGGDIPTTRTAMPRPYAVVVVDLLDGRRLSARADGDLGWLEIGARAKVEPASHSRPIAAFALRD